MHVPVLLKESLDLLDLHEGDVYLDATLGEGGHAAEVQRRFGDKVVVVGIDADPQAPGLAKVKSANLNFREIGKAPEILGIPRPTKILFDLGWSKEQQERLSFKSNEPLDMRLGGETGFNAYTIVNSWDEENIKTIIEAYGEERFANRIAKKIVEARQTGEIKTGAQLAEIVKSATPLFYHFRRIHPATKTFQALRIAVNDELRALEDGLKGAFEILASEGRIAVISFHSLEDRVVKRFFKSLENIEILTKRPVTASDEEIKENPRSRSAKLRVILKK